MGNYVNGFGFYEFLALLVPGTVFSYSALYYLYYWKIASEVLKIYSLKAESFVVISIMGSFVVGIILQELGTIIDRRFGYMLLYGGNPDVRWAKDCLKIKCGEQNIRNTAIAQICERCQCDSKTVIGNPDQYFFYMLNTLEANGIGGKAEKMMIASELSRSLALGSCILLFFHIAAGIWGSIDVNVTYILILAVLIAMIALFTQRKVRYEKHRFSTIIRTFVILEESISRKQKNSHE